MQIHFLDKTNASLLTQVAPDVFDNEICSQSLHEFIECPRHAMVLAVDQAQVIGMASGVEYFHPDKDRQFWINEVGVTPKRRNQGIGRKLVSALLEYARERDCVCAWLGTEQTNAAANQCFSQIEGGERPQNFVLYEWNIERGHRS